MTWYSIQNEEYWFKHSKAMIIYEIKNGWTKIYFLTYFILSITSTNLGLGLWCLMPLQTIFQLYHVTFYFWHVSYGCNIDREDTMYYVIKFVSDLWFSPGTPVSSTNQTDRHDITEILFEVALSIITLTLN